MKKRLPTLILFFSAAILLLILYLWPKTEASKDTDNDGFPDTIDKCIDVASTVNNGCPEITVEKPVYQVDKDGDGYFNIELSKDRKADPNDRNACLPNPKCGLCDQDGDLLTNAQELAKGTDPQKKDTDSDGVNDSVDRCPTTPGLSENQGCVLVLNSNLRATGSEIVWNENLVKYADEIYLDLGNNQRISVNGTYQHDLLADATSVATASNSPKRGRVYDVEFIVKLKDSRKVQLTGNTKLRIKIPQ